MFKLKSGEEINTNEKPKGFIKKEYNGSDPIVRIMRALIKAEKPLRMSELVRESGIYRELLQYHLENMIANGLVITAQENGKKYYAPQQIFWDNDILLDISESLIPIIKIINKSIDYAEIDLDLDETIVLINNLQMSLKLFNFEIDEIKGGNE